MTNILAQYKNVIDFSKYQDESIKTAELEKRFPLIYALHAGNGDPLILFRFVKDENTASTHYKNNVVQLNLGKNK